VTGFNLSAWGLRHQTLVLFLIVMLGLAGMNAYQRLGRAEDPDFTIKVMVVTAQWPGATAREMELQVTDKIEKKLQEVPYFDYTASYAKPGETVIKVTLRSDTPPAMVPESWYQVRKKLNDIRHTFPQGLQGPFFNDEFGDTFGTIFAFSADGFSDAELKKYVEGVRQRLLKVRDVSKVELFGTQDEKLFVEFSHQRLATLGLPAQSLFDALARYTSVNPTGVFETPSDRVAIRLDGVGDTADAIRDIPLQANGRSLRLGDIADVRREYQDPPVFTMRYMGRPVIGLGISMAKGGDVLKLGDALNAEMALIERDLPIGIEVQKIADQPRVVKDSIGEFLRVLAEALAIVLAVSFLSLGLRTGIVVALSVPLVLAITFVAMDAIGINLHRISLGALIIALGLLVDDAIIAVEMMVVKMEEGWDRIKAATFAYSSTAFPMLTGTLITAAGFLPVGFAKSSAGEFTGSIFWVVGIALIVSWVVAVLFTPYLGYKLLPDFTRRKGGGGHGHAAALYDTRVYRALRAGVEFCLRWRKSVVLATLLVFVASIGAFRFVQQQFFPAASRPELLVELRLPGGASFAATEAAVARLETILAADGDVATYVVYTGGGTPRFYLPLNPELRNPNYAQFVVVTKGLQERERAFERLRHLFDHAPDFEGLRGRVTRLENGPPVGFPVQFRVIGEDPARIRDIAYEVRDIMRRNPHTRDVNLEWNELSKSVRLEIDRERARALGVNAQDLAQTLNTLVSGQRVAQVRDGTELIDVIARAVPAERLGIEGFEGLNVAASGGKSVPLAQIATVRYELEEPVLWRRNRETMIAVRADIADATQAPVVTLQIDPQLDAIRAKLPPGYRIDVGGAIEESVKSQASIFAVMPAMVAVMVTLLMIQLQSFSRVALVLLTAPLGMIGVALALLLFQQPFGFVAMLGVISLAGMIMRNSVILVDQIDQDIKAGATPYEAIVGATIRRARPIVLTAAAAILAMIPLTRSVFWGPMAIAIMGGLAVATVLTIFFLPALYALWFRVRAPAPTMAAAAGSAPLAAPAPAE